MSDSPSLVKVLFASGSAAVIQSTLDRLTQLHPPLPVVVVSEFAPASGEWIPYHIHRSKEENADLIRSKLAGRTIAIAAVILEPQIPHQQLRALGYSLAPQHCIAFNETGRHFRVGPRGLPGILRHVARRAKQSAIAAAAPNSRVRRTLRGLTDPDELRLPLLYRKALARGRTLAARPVLETDPVSQSAPRPEGVSVVIPSRNGRDLLQRCLDKLTGPDEIIIVDNGSDDGTATWLATLSGNAMRKHADIIIEQSLEPLAFAEAVNRGIRRARYSHVCLLNNDMEVEPGFLQALRKPFDTIPDLFCSSAQIFLPEGQRREETGKTVWNPEPAVTGLPIHCDIPLENEDLSYVLYGSGGCSLYDAAKLQSLGCFDEIYKPAYVEDLDLGVRAWLKGWPSVYCANARVLHQHRTTTSRYFTPDELDLTLERNFSRFLARTINSPELFTQLWNHNVLRLKALRKGSALAFVANQPIDPVPPGDLQFLDLVNGQVCVFPGHEPRSKPVVLIASPYLPFPLSHGAAVRIYNLLRQASNDFDVVLLAFVEESKPAPQELLDLCIEVVTIHRKGTHAPPSRGRPDIVEEFDTPAFHAALKQTIRKWNPGIVQLEFTQMAIYADDCKPAKTILVEHDITFDLYAQLLERTEQTDWETKRQHELWLRFETAAWKQVDSVVTMSDKDRLTVEAPRALAVPNGVDLERFTPTEESPDPRRLLFIGSFAHRPNVLALEWFLKEVFPQLPGVTLHVIAGQNHQRFWDLQHPGVEVEGFVSDVRPAYRKATLVIAPLVASAGTNVKILEAMAMGKAIVSTDAGIHGLDLRDQQDLVLVNTPADTARAIRELLDSPAERIKLEQQARITAERVYGWDAIAQVQKKLYNKLLS